ncbi:MAG: hypothetical protein ABI147_00880 [Acidobacteriaceae bacterium]
MAEVSKAIRFHAFSWWGSIFALGNLLGALGYHFLELRKFDDIQEQLTVIQRQIAPPAPAQDAKSTLGGSQKGFTGIETDFGLECGLYSPASKVSCSLDTRSWKGILEETRIPPAPQAG